MIWLSLNHLLQVEIQYPAYLLFLFQNKKHFYLYHDLYVPFLCNICAKLPYILWLTSQYWGWSYTKSITMCFSQSLYNSTFMYHITLICIFRKKLCTQKINNWIILRFFFSLLFSHTIYHYIRVIYWNENTDGKSFFCNQTANPF